MPARIPPARRIRSRTPLRWLIAGWWIAQTAPAGAQTQDLTQASLETLMSIEVTTVSRKEQPLSRTASAIYVIGEEDIRRSGAQSLPEILRLVPGLHVAHIDANKWAVSARGFNGRFANKMLVLVDGRSVYTPLFSGVYWDVQDTLLEDIERIEVVRGPGAAVWGANAVNGVINIITKPSRDTQGALVSLGGGSTEQGFGAVRYGGAIGAHGSYRVFTKYFNRTGFLDPAGRIAGDGWDTLRTGARFDWRLPAGHDITVEGGAYDGSFGQMIDFDNRLSYYSGTQRPTEGSGGNILARWNRRFADDSDLSVQVYYDHTRRDDPLAYERRDTADVDFQHHFAAGAHDLVWGAGYRTSADELRSSPAVRFAQERRTTGLFSTFLQDEIAIRPERFHLTLGTKLEHSEYTHWELQPNVRALWTPGRTQSVWGSVSRAVRTPSRAEDSIEIALAPTPGPLGPPIAVAILGSPAFRSETLWAYEAGYRLQPVQRLSIDIATFYNAYDRLRTLEALEPAVQVQGGLPMVVMPLVFANGASGRAAGVEASVNYSLTPAWRVSTAYSGLNVRIDGASTAFDLPTSATEDDSPAHMFRALSQVEIGDGFELDLAASFVDRLRQQQIPAYTRADVRLGWRPAGAMELSLNLQNLFDSHHQEFGSTFGEQPTQLRRAIYAKALWQF